MYLEVTINKNMLNSDLVKDIDKDKRNNKDYEGGDFTTSLNIDSSKMVPQGTLNENIKENRSNYFFAFLLVGIFNNNGFTVVQAASSDLAKIFHREDFMGLFLFFMKSFGLVSRFVNGSCCVRVAHTTRMWIVSVFTFGSYVAIAYACIHDDNQSMFNLAIGASVFTGISQSFGEAVYLGFLKGFPPDLIGDVSTGTGISGIFATTTLALAGYSGISN